MPRTRRTPHPSHPNNPSGTHTEHEDHAWTIGIPDHPARTESEGFRRSKATAHKILQVVARDSSGAAILLRSISKRADIMTAPVQAHHAGSLWVFDGTGWFLLLNICGVEWSAQWSAEPQRIDVLRQNAQRLYARFPETITELAKLGYPEARQVLEEPITDHAGVARWTDSIFNSCVLLSPALHQAIVSSSHQVGGWHHYPKPIWDIQVTKRDDFNLWVVDAEGHEHAVAPMAHRGSGDGRVRVLWSHPSSRLHAEHRAHEARGEEHVLPEDHDLARQAFAQQGGPA